MRESKPLVLIIDDDPKIREGLSRRLRCDEFAIATAASGAEAMPLVRSKAVAVVLCDERMPGQSGISVLSAIRDQSPSTVRMMLTGAPCVSLALRAINTAGVYHFFTKPCDTQELALSIRDAIRYHKTIYESRLAGAKYPPARRRVEACASESQVAYELSLDEEHDTEGS